MKNLIIGSNYMEIITAIQMKRTILKDEHVDLFLTRDPMDIDAFASRLSREGLFDRIRVIDGKDFLWRGKPKVELVLGTIEFNLGKKVKRSFDKLLDGEAFEWESIYYTGADYFVIYIFDRCLENGQGARCVHYDGGLMNYPVLYHYSNKSKINEFLRRIRHKRSMYYYHKSAMFFPELVKQLYGENEETRSIPLLSRDDTELVGLLNRIFNYAPQKDVFKERYIYFPSPYAKDGIHVDDMDVLNRVADVVGRDNILVKAHPRDDDYQRYQRAGFHLNDNNQVPWEVIQLNHDYTGKVFLTLTSTSIIEASSFLNDNIKSYYLYKLIETNDRRYPFYCNKVEVMMELLHKNKMCMDVAVVSTGIEEIIS